MMNKYRLLFSWQFILITLKIVMFFNSVIPSLGFCPKKIFLGMGENSYQEGIPPDVVYPHFHVMVIGRPWNRAPGAELCKARTSWESADRTGDRKRKENQECKFRAKQTYETEWFKMLSPSGWSRASELKRSLTLEIRSLRECSRLWILEKFPENGWRAEGGSSHRASGTQTVGGLGDTEPGGKKINFHEQRNG